METVAECLSAARNARKENNIIEAKRQYELILASEENYSNKEARFFAACYDILYANASEVYDKYMEFSEVILLTLAGFKNLDMDEEEKYELLTDMSFAVRSLPWKVYSKLLSDNSTKEDQEKILSVNRSSIGNLYLFGDILESEYESNLDDSPAKFTAIGIWKEGIELQRKWCAVGYEASAPREYEKKIKKYDASYVLPKENIFRKIWGYILVSASKNQK